MEEFPRGEVQCADFGIVAGDDGVVGGVGVGGNVDVVRYSRRSGGDVSHYSGVGFHDVGAAEERFVCELAVQAADHADSAGRVGAEGEGGDSDGGDEG